MQWVASKMVLSDPHLILFRPSPWVWNEPSNFLLMSRIWGEKKKWAISSEVRFQKIVISILFTFCWPLAWCVQAGHPEVLETSWVPDGHVHCLRTSSPWGEAWSAKGPSRAYGTCTDTLRHACRAQIRDASHLIKMDSGGGVGWDGGRSKWWLRAGSGTW